MEKTNSVNLEKFELSNCKECGQQILKNKADVCNRCQDPYYLEDFRDGICS